VRAIVFQLRVFVWEEASVGCGVTLDEIPLSRVVSKPLESSAMQSVRVKGERMLGWIGTVRKSTANVTVAPTSS
jgi:hypothetical protein